MANYSELKTAIENYIGQNGNNEITGSILQNVLKTIVSSIGANATFAGVASTSTNPGTPDGPVFYITNEAGTYVNFGNLAVNDCLHILTNIGGNWALVNTHSIILGNLDNIDEPIVFTESKAMNAFIKTLYVDKNRYEQTQETTVSDIYATWNSSSRHFYLYDAPTGGTLMLDIDMSSSMAPIYCFGNNLGTFIYLELDTEKLQNSPSIGALPSASNPRPKLTSFATTHVCDPRIKNGGFTESPILNKYIKKIWVEITSNYAGSIDDIIGKLTVYTLSSIYDAETEKWTNKIIIRPQSGTNGFLYNSTSNDNEVIINRASVSTMYNGVVIHAQIDWESLRLDGGNFNAIRTYLTPKAYNPVFWGIRLSDEVGDNSSIAFTQKGAKTLSTRIDNIDSQLSTIENYTSEDLTDGYWNVGSKEIGDKMPTTPTQVFTWYCTIPIMVKKGMVITLSTKGGNNGRAWILTDADKYILSKAEAGVDTTSEPVTLNILQDGFLYANHQAINNTEANKAKFSLRTSINNVASYDNEITELRNDIENLHNNAVSVAKLFNPKADLKKSQLRVLDIGNSFTNNALGIGTDGSVGYIGRFVEAAGISTTDLNFCLYKAIRSSGTFKTWYDCYHDNDTVVYSIIKQIGGLTQTLNGNQNNDTKDTENNNAGDGSLFRSCLQDNTWDLILIHQASDYSTDDINTLEGNGNGGYLKEFVRLLRTLQPSATIGFLFTHVANNQSLDSDTAARFEEMCKSVKQVCSSYGIDFIIPVGAAIENLRTFSHDETQELISPTTNNFSKDNKHLAAGLAAYVAAATYFQSLLAPRYGVSVLGNTFNSTFETSSSSEIVNVTQTTAPIAQMCAILAVNDMWNINNPNGVEL